MRARFAALLWMCSLLFAGHAYAHKPSDSYLSLTAATDGSELAGQWDIALRDLEHAIGIDSNGDGNITWGELRNRRREIEQYAFAHLTITRAGTAPGACPIHDGDLLVDEHVDGSYAVLRFVAACAARPGSELVVSYSLLFDVDPNHRGLLDVHAGPSTYAAVLSMAHPAATMKVGSPQAWTQFRSFLADGIQHILHGYDHVLFLLTLLLPAVVIYQSGRWEPRASLRDAAVDVAKVVTAFTLAHSLTLSLAVTGIVNIPSRIIESAIAFTVVVGALNNLVPVVTQRRWLVAFTFGLVHGFGFASVLRDLGLEGGRLALALLGFNLGVEVGQLAIVLVLVPLAYWLRPSFLYRRVLMPGGAVMIVAVGCYWFCVRAFGL